jgi:hypothetical protein
MKTPMQELIETFKEIQKDQEPYFFSVNKAIELAESMLEKEKEVMTHFATRHKFEGGNAVRLYEETFNTKV